MLFGQGGGDQKQSIKERLYAFQFPWNITPGVFPDLWRVLNLLFVTTHKLLYGLHLILMGELRDRQRNEEEKVNTQTMNCIKTIVQLYKQLYKKSCIKKRKGQSFYKICSVNFTVVGQGCAQTLHTRVKHRNAVALYFFYCKNKGKKSLKVRVSVSKSSQVRFLGSGWKHDQYCVLVGRP